MSYVFQASVTMTMVTFAIIRRNSQTLTCYFSWISCFHTVTDLMIFSTNSCVLVSLV